MSSKELLSTEHPEEGIPFKEDKVSINAEVTPNSLEISWSEFLLDISQHSFVLGIGLLKLHEQLGFLSSLQLQIFADLPPEDYETSYKVAGILKDIAAFRSSVEKAGLISYEYLVTNQDNYQSFKQQQELKWKRDTQINSFVLISF